MELRAGFALILGLFLSMALVPPLVRVAGPLGLMDTGGGRKVHAGRIPRIGGIAIFVGFLVPVLLWAPLRSELGVIVAAVTVLFVFGLLDDRFNLDYRLKLLGQLLAAGIVTLGAGVLIQRVPLWPGGLLPELLALPLTWLVLAGLTNAVNLSDGLDGLAGGIGLLAVAGLLVLAVESDAGALLIVLAALLGAILGFLRFNTHPAQLFMGDSGSQLLGFSIGVLAVLMTQRPAADLSPMLPLLVLGLPILDMLTVMIGRIRRGQSPFAADRTHLHHRLLDAGLTQTEAVSLVYGLQFALIVLAYLLRHAADGLVVATALGVGGLLLLSLWLIERYRGELRERTLRQLPLDRVAGWLRRTGGPTRLALRLLRIALPLFLVLGTLAAPVVSRDIGVLAAALAGTLGLAMWIRPIPVFPVERLSTYTLALAVAYLLTGSPVATACPACMTFVYGALAVTAAIYVWQSSTGFQVNSLDLLILLGALVAPSLRGFGLAELGVLALHAVILLYGVEVLMQAQQRRWDWLRIATFGGLGVLAARGLLML